MTHHIHLRLTETREAASDVFDAHLVDRLRELLGLPLGGALIIENGKAKHRYFVGGGSHSWEQEDPLNLSPEQLAAIPVLYTIARKIKENHR